MKTKIYFTVEELTLIKSHKNINSKIGREELIEILKNSIKYSEDDLLKDWMSDTVEKLEQISDEEFNEINFILTMDAED
ncbi:transposon-transfer assisting family protein [Sedimentibacter sp. MB31-C6]|uniref:transposon-transfer assisting family protein n=1 Tax=Sedimentibacter sp. MB31-C6 TaxID=3109366 RepID=UPI002DDCF51F|nr:transposon-transfer assisting family protein [Sedimentibacter sp. MB36-C1]WSI05142.1 transposon-transfer assisting family protein [Sedimentibacter sp. MB36-C1]